ncbi:concanavalin A-like lectin/glucanase [Tanacetum coccineum]
MMDQICNHFSLDEIRSATKDFSEAFVVGQGGFGKVYKGYFKDRSSMVVAVKRSNSTSSQGAPEFRAEVEMLSKLRHCNLVSLIGYCNEGTEMALVYEYMSQGSLEDHIHKSGSPLSWLRRLKICIGAARGLDYLHTGTGTQHGIVHRDVKSSNILLDENFAAKISDFGLAKVTPTNQTHTHVSTGVKGTFGYMDPCYFYSGKLTRKSDVYAFGVVLLEVMCGRPAVDESLDEDQWGLAPWAQDRIREGKLNRIIDSRLTGQISSKCLKKFGDIACRCLHDIPNQRPTMAEIVARLEAILSLQERLSFGSQGKFSNKVHMLFAGQLKTSNLISALTSFRLSKPSTEIEGK